MLDRGRRRGELDRPVACLLFRAVFRPALRREFRAPLGWARRRVALNTVILRARTSPASCSQLRGTGWAILPRFELPQRTLATRRDVLCPGGGASEKRASCHRAQVPAAENLPEPPRSRRR